LLFWPFRLAPLWFLPLPRAEAVKRVSTA
jgi:hypothetical protein